MAGKLQSYPFVIEVSQLPHNLSVIACRHTDPEAAITGCVLRPLMYPQSVVGVY